MYNEAREKHERQIKYAARKEMIRWIKRMKLPWWLTLNTNRNTTPETLKRNIGRFLAQVDRYALGNRFRDYTDKRTFLVGYIEDGTYWHTHAGFWLPETLRRPKKEIEAVLTECWKSVVPSGSIWLRHTIKPNDRYQVMRYTTKRFREFNFEDRLVTSTMFWPDNGDRGANFSKTVLMSLEDIASSRTIPKHFGAPATWASGMRKAE